MESTAQPVHRPVSSTASPSRLLSMPPELLNRIARLVVLEPDTINVLRGRSKHASRLYVDRPGFLNLASTCRQLYQTSIKQAYAGNDFTFQTLTTNRHPTTFKAFYQQIGPINAGCISSVCLHGTPPDEEFDILFMFSALRELRIDILNWADQGEAESAFCERVSELQPIDVPSLRHLRIDIEKVGGHTHRRRRPFTRWNEIDYAVDVARESNGAQVEIDLCETEVWNQDGRTFWVRRKYISAGVYERIDFDAGQVCRTG